MNYDDPDKVPSVWQVGDVVLDLYEVKEVFTGGGMGLVYRVHHRGWDMDLAVKSPRPEFFQHPQQVENFEREAETWVNLGLHPHTVSCYYVRRLGGIPRIFAEFIEGGSLADWIRSRRLYEGGSDIVLERILDIAIQFAWGLHYAHEQGLIHQDVKPGNVLMDTDGTAKVTDFGLAKARAIAGRTPISSTEQSIFVTSGGMTPAYCSPEQANGKPLSRKTDIWSWGISIFEMFVGEPPCRHGGQLAAEVFGSYLDTSVEEDAMPLLPKPLAHLLNDCFQSDPKRRPQDLYQLTERLKTVFRQLIGTNYPRIEARPVNLLADGLNNRGVSMVDLRKHVEAEKCFREALTSYPGHPQATYNLGLLQWRSAQTSDRDVLHRLDQVKQAHDTDWVVPYMQSLIHLERCDAASAIEQASRALELSKENAGLVALEQARSLKSKTVGSVEDFEPIARVIRLGLSDDGCWAISSDEKGTLFLWEVAAARRIRTFEGHQGIVLAVSFSANKRWMLSAGMGMTLRLWDVASGTCIREFQGHAHLIDSVRLSKDARWGCQVVGIAPLVSGIWYPVSVSKCLTDTPTT